MKTLLSRSKLAAVLAPVLALMLSSCGASSDGSILNEGEGQQPQGQGQEADRDAYTFEDPTLSEVETSSEVIAAIASGAEVPVELELPSQSESLAMLHGSGQSGQPQDTQVVAGPRPEEQGPLAEEPQDGYLLSGEGAAGTLDVIERIVAIGEKVYQVVRDNRATQNVNTRSASALPQGTTVEQMSNCTEPQYRSFALAARNLFRVETVRLEYTLVYQYACQANGRGRYLTNVRVHPTHIKVLWGYTLNFSVDDMIATNLGSGQDPIANMAVYTTATISTLLKTGSSGKIFSIRGDNGAVTQR